MSDDLISRSAVREIIENEIKSTEAFIVHATQIDIMYKVAALPTAYDVDSVVEKLEKNIADAQKSHCKTKRQAR